MLCSRFFNNLLACIIIAMIDDLIAVSSSMKHRYFDKSLLTTQKWNFSSITTKHKIDTQHLQHHQFMLQQQKQHPTVSAFCGQQQEERHSQQQQSVVLNCNAINVMADNFPNEIQNDIENEIQTEKRNDLLSKNSTLQTSSSPSSSLSSMASTLLTLSKTAVSSPLRATSSSSSVTSSSSSSSLIVASALTSASSSSSASVGTTTQITSSTVPTTLTPLLAASSLMTVTTPALPLNFKLKRILSRPKRFIAFPEGSSLSVAVCFTVGIIGNPRYNYMAFGLNWGVSYDLPNTSWILNHLHGFSRHSVPPTVLRRRTRRSLYKEVERLMDNMGYNGRECILRALCESRQYFERTKMGMIGEMLRVVFSLPKQRIFTRELHENSDIKLYDHAYRKARDIDCAHQYDCSFSLLELALGRYSTPPPGYY